MDRVAVFVDAGYLFAQGSQIIAGKKLRRGETRLDEAKLLEILEKLATEVSGLPLLRIYWYDGTDSGPSPAHISVASQPNVKIRLGIVNTYGQQKGVDSLIVSDLINLSRNGAMSDALLLTGDEDIRVGVQQAQDVGVRKPATPGGGHASRTSQDGRADVSDADCCTSSDFGNSRWSWIASRSCTDAGVVALQAGCDASGEFTVWQRPPRYRPPTPEVLLGSAGARPDLQREARIAG